MKQAIKVVDDTSTLNSASLPSVEWTRLIEKYESTVIERLAASGLSHDEAREYSQAAWVRLFERHRQSSVSRLRLPGLVIVVARNLFIDAYRRQSRHWAALPMNLATSVAGPERIVERRTLLRLVDRQLEQIGGRDEAIFVAVVIEERPILEVAFEHGISRSQTYSTVARVRAKLQRAAVKYLGG